MVVDGSNEWSKDRRLSGTCPARWLVRRDGRVLQGGEESRKGVKKIEWVQEYVQVEMSGWAVLVGGMWYESSRVVAAAEPGAVVALGRELWSHQTAETSCPQRRVAKMAEDSGLIRCAGMLLAEPCLRSAEMTQAGAGGWRSS